MAKGVIDADGILNRARPWVDQHAHEIHPFGHLVKLPIALAENVCKESVDNLNQLLADTITLRDLYKKHHWPVQISRLLHAHEIVLKEARTMARLAADVVLGRRRAGRSAALGRTSFLAVVPPACGPDVRT